MSKIIAALACFICTIFFTFIYLEEKDTYNDKITKYFFLSLICVFAFGFLRIVL